MGDDQAQTVSNAPPGYVTAAARPYGRAVTQFGQNYDPQFFPGQTYADQSPYSAGAIEGMGSFSSAPSQDYYQSVMQGDYLGLNPAMQAAVMDPAMDASAGRFEVMGRYGSPSSQVAMAKAGMESLMPYYDSERRRQGQAAAALPMMRQSELQTQLGGGQLAEQYAQRPISEDMARWNFEQQAPYNNIQAWGSALNPLLGANLGSTQTQTTPGGSSLAGGIGGALSGAQLGNALSAGSWLGAGPGMALGPAGWAGLALGGLAGLM